MGSCTLRLGMAFALMSGFWHGVCQPGSFDAPQQDASDPTVYVSFFRQVAQRQNISGPILLNGQLSSLTQPTIQDAIGLTEQEVQVLNTLASDCEARIRSLDNAVRPLIFEGRLQLIESARTPLWLIQMSKDLDNQRNQIVLVQIQQLKAAFGDARFQMLDAYVRSRKQVSFFPPVPVKN